MNVQRDGYKALTQLFLRMSKLETTLSQLISQPTSMKYQNSRPTGLDVSTQKIE